MAASQEHSNLAGRLEEHGYRGRVISIDHLSDIKKEIERAREGKLLDDAFYTERISGFDFSLPDHTRDIRSMIIIAYPDPLVIFTCRWKGQTFRLVVPPTYLHWNKKDRQAENILDELIAPGNFRFYPANVPKKLLAGWSGLALYGQNNITYIKGWGSFFRLTAFLSDYPCDSDYWEEPQVMERCKECRACLIACPTKAIPGDRFVLHAERCLTFWNEKPGNVMFPEWLDSKWHHCLIGCMRCQTVCPENRDILDFFQMGPEFSEEETDLLLHMTETDKLPDALFSKLEDSDLLDIIEYIPRNLKKLLKSPLETSC
jgi:epoxyqueuosine reductase